jgi:predicted RNA-binding protein
MKTSKVKQTMVLASVMTAAAALSASADQAAMPAGGPESWYTGKVMSVDPQNHMVGVRSWFLSRKEFSLGDNCAYSFPGINNGTVADLRPGQKITVRYVDSQGVRIADRVAERPMQYEGTVLAIDPNQHVLTLRAAGMDRHLTIADGCNVGLRDNKSGVLGDIHTGDYVIVTYEKPGDRAIARQIAQTSMAFTGKLTAIDLDQKTVKAQGPAGTKRFNLADNCAIVIKGQRDGKLDQLKPDERLVFNYDTINGVNVVNRIAPAPPEQHSTASTSPGYPGYPMGY